MKNKISKKDLDKLIQSIGKPVIISHCSQQPLRMVNESDTGEVSDGKKSYILEGVFGVISDKPNNNGRIYDESEYLPHVKALRDEIQNRSLLGELDHPDPNIMGTPRMDTHLKYISHQILNIWYDKDRKYIMGRIKILPTMYGNIARTLVDEGIPIYISSRASGYVMKNQHVKINKIITYDLVAKPGFDEAVLNPVAEGVDHSHHNQSIFESYRDSTNEKRLWYEAQKGTNANASCIALNENVRIYGLFEGSSDVEKKSDKNKDDAEVIGITSVYEVPEQIPDRPSMGIVPASEDPDPLTPGQLGTEEIVNAIADGFKKGVEELKNSGLLKDSEDDGIEISDAEPKILSGKALTDADMETPIIRRASVKYVNDLTDEEKRVENAKSLDEKANITMKRICSNTNNIISDIDTLMEKFDMEQSNIRNLQESHGWASALNDENLKMALCLDESSLENVSFFILSNGLFRNPNDPQIIRDLNEHFVQIIDMANPIVIKEETWLSKAPKIYREAFMNSPKPVRDGICETASILQFNSMNDILRFWSDTGIISEESILHEQMVERNRRMVKCMREVHREDTLDRRVNKNTELMERVRIAMER